MILRCVMYVAHHVIQCVMCTVHHVTWCVHGLQGVESEKCASFTASLESGKPVYVRAMSTLADGQSLNALVRCTALYPITRNKCCCYL